MRVWMFENLTRSVREMRAKTKIKEEDRKERLGRKKGRKRNENQSRGKRIYKKWQIEKSLFFYDSAIGFGGRKQIPFITTSPTPTPLRCYRRRHYHPHPHRLQRLFVCPSVPFGSLQWEAKEGYAFVEPRANKLLLKRRFGGLPETVCCVQMMSKNTERTKREQVVA